MIQTIDFDVFRVVPGEVLLDVGCGTGRHSFSTKIRGVTIVSLDIDEKPLNKISQKLDTFGEAPNGNRIHLLRGDALQLPLPDESVDKVLCSEVLEHIWRDEDCIRELNRVLKPSGGLAVSVPTHFSELIYDCLADEYLGKPGGHVHVFTREELVKKIEDGGFRVLRTDTCHSLHFFYWFLRATFGMEEEDNFLPKVYYSFLKRADRSLFWQRVEAELNGIFPKSFVIYARKPNRPL